MISKPAPTHLFKYREAMFDTTCEKLFQKYTESKKVKEVKNCLLICFFFG